MPQKVNVTQAITKRDQSECFAIRTEVFVEEQGVPKEEELDGLDQTSIHALARINSIPVATGRLITIDNKNARIGRMAVKIEYRRIGVASLVLYFLEEKARKKGIQLITLEAQKYVKQFYSDRGYSEHGGIFLDVGIPHVKMVKELR
tara:strand:+ start:210 stop:650 length:441 start_codon:yes stop_codon:yes gene_type:complete